MSNPGQMIQAQHFQIDRAYIGTAEGPTELVGKEFVVLSIEDHFDGDGPYISATVKVPNEGSLTEPVLFAPGDVAYAAKRLKYTLDVQYAAGIPQGAVAEPVSSNQHANLPDVLYAFENWCYAMGRSDITEADGGPIGWVYVTSEWDGISYGDGLVGCYTYRGGRSRRPQMERA